MPKIDNQMLQIHQRCTQDNSALGRMISQNEARLLISRAHEINTTTSNSFRSENHRGNKYLLRLMNEHQADFDKSSRRLIERYIETGEIPRESRSSRSIGSSNNRVAHNGESRGSSNNRVVHNGESRGSGTNRVVHNGESRGSGNNRVLHNDESRGDRRHRGNRNRSGDDLRPNPRSRSNDVVLERRTNHGSERHRTEHRASPSNDISRQPGFELREGRRTGVVTHRVLSEHPLDIPPGVPIPRNSDERGSVMRDEEIGRESLSSPHPNGGVTEPDIIEHTDPVGPVDVVDEAREVSSPGVVIDFVADKRTWGCHWFPMQETKPGGDPINNLYSDGGPLAKLDMLTGKRAQAYEYANKRKPVDAGKEYSWWGHCNDASQAACVLQEPKHAVVMVGQDGTEVKFSKNDIQGLLVKAVPNLVSKVDFRGERFNSATRDDPNDPRPELFLEVMQEWSSDGLPFVLDIDRKEQVWNFPYDQVKVSESTTAPDGFDSSNLPADGSVKYFHIEMAGTGFDAKARTYECYVQRDENGQVMSSGWIKTPNSHNNPDFMWRPHPIGDLMDRSMWQPRGKTINPEVDLQVVYDIYLKSLA